MNYLSDQQRKVVEENAPLVNYVIQKYVCANPDPSLFQYQDLFQIGCIGLAKAARSFNPEAGFTFATFASKCILNQIRMSFRKPRITTVSMNQTFHNKNGDSVSLENLFRDESQELTGIYTARSIQDFLLKRIQRSEKDAVIVQAMFKTITQYQAAQAIQCSQAQVSRYVNKLRAEIKETFL